MASARIPPLPTEEVASPSTTTESICDDAGAGAGAGVGAGAFAGSGDNGSTAAGSSGDTHVQQPALLEPEYGHASRVVLLFYKYTPVVDVELLQRSQTELCTRLGLVGRVRVAGEGLNGTLSGTAAGINEYIKVMHRDERFSDVDWKQSIADRDAFPGLAVKVVSELVSSGNDLLEVDLALGGEHLSPTDFHERLKVGREAGDVVVVDVRNTYEARVGHFAGSVDPGMRNFMDWAPWVDKNADMLRSKQVMLYCTGGIRCEKASAYMRARGIERVAQLQGGIHRWRGKLFVFDKRRTVATEDLLGASVSAESAQDTVVGECRECHATFEAFSDDVRCAYCRMLILMCNECREHIAPPQRFCDAHAWLGVPVEELRTMGATLEREWAAERSRRSAVARTADAPAGGAQEDVVAEDVPPTAGDSASTHTPAVPHRLRMLRRVLAHVDSGGTGCAAAR